MTTLDYYLSIAGSVYTLGVLIYGGWVFALSPTELLVPRIIKAVATGLSWPIPVGIWLWQQITSKPGGRP